MPEQFWFSDPSVLFQQDTWTLFVPTQSMTTTEALNAVLRFTIYASVVLALFTGTPSYLIAIPMVAVVSVILHQLFPNGKKLETFMNVLLTDKPDRPDAAPVSDKKVRAQIYKAFQQTSDIYMDTSDLFDQTQAMRTFHTMQSATVPNDQDAFLALLAKGYDDADTSSAFPSRGGKILSEGYVNSRGAMRNLENATCKPTGTAPLSTDTSTPTSTAT